MNLKAFRTVLGGVLIELSLGSLYTAANMITYIISYIHVVVGDTSVTNTMSAWLFAISIMGQACSMMFAGKIEDRIGSRWCTLLGCALFDICVLVSYWIADNFYLLLAVYGFLFGICIGIAYSAPITMSIKWMPGKGGFASGIIVAGFGCGPLIFNQVQSSFINPNNLPTVIDPTGATTDKYFPFEVASRVPNVFLLLTACYVVLQAIGLLLVVEPTEAELAAMKEHVVPIMGDLKAKSTGYTPRDFRPTVEATPRGQHVITSTGAMVDHPYKPSEAMRTVKFWEIWGTFLLVGLTTTFMSSYWKVFGQSFISDDHFLVLAGSVSSVCNGVFRPLWGMLMDKWTYRRAMPFLCLCTALLIGTLSLTAKLPQAFFFLWICLIYLCMGGFYAMFPAYTSLSFGTLYLTSNYGYVFTNQFISAFCSAFLVNAFITILGNTGITIFLAIMVLLALLLSAFGKKWDYHVGRRELHSLSPTATLPASVTLPPAVAAAAANTPATPAKEVVDVPKVETVETKEEAKVETEAKVEVAGEEKKEGSNENHGEVKVEVESAKQA